MAEGISSILLFKYQVSHQHKSATNIPTSSIKLCNFHFNHHIRYPKPQTLPLAKMPSITSILSLSLLLLTTLTSAAPTTTKEPLSKRQDDNICIGISFYTSDDCSGTAAYSTTITDWSCYNLDTSYSTWKLDDPTSSAQINVYDLANCHGSNTYGDEPMPALNLHGCNMVRGAGAQVQSVNLNLAGQSG